MSIARELNWTTAAKPKFGKATEHSGAKKGKGAWDTKKVAKKDSNKGRRAGGKQEIKDQTVGDEADGPFPGAAPPFKKAAAMHWTTAEPRPCWPTEDPEDAHCNEGIAPPAPGGGDDMSSGPPGGSSDPLYEKAQDFERDARFEREGGKPDKADEILRQADEQREQAYKLDEDLDLERQAEERPDPLQKSEEPLDDFGGGDPWDDIDDMQDPMENAGPPSPDGMGPQDSTPSPDGMGPQENDGQQMSDMHGPRDPGLSPDAPHQFWAQEAPHIQDALNKYLIPQLSNPDFKVSQKARKILQEGPHATNFAKNFPHM